MSWEQLDLLDELRRVEREDSERRGVPRLFGSAARGLDARTAELDRWKEVYGTFGCLRDSHAWHVPVTAPSRPTMTCQATLLSADLCCDHEPGARCECVGDDVWRGACTACQWEGAIRADEDHAVADALDHCFPGWREDAPTPVGEVGDRHRPTGWPSVTTRSAGAGTRAVPGRSPWGGYDADITILQFAEE